MPLLVGSRDIPIHFPKHSSFLLGGIAALGNAQCLPKNQYIISEKRLVDRIYTLGDRISFMITSIDHDGLQKTDASSIHFWYGSQGWPVSFNYPRERAIFENHLTMKLVRSHSTSLPLLLTFQKEKPIHHVQISYIVCITMDFFFINIAIRQYKQKGITIGFIG